MPPGATEYCKLCKKLFSSHAEYHRHKLQSPDHITCDVCSADFQDLKALKSHRDRLHALEQSITCLACNEHFVRAGSYVSHIENRQCTKYRHVQDMSKLREKKEEVEENLLKLKIEGESLGRPSPSPRTGTFPVNVKDDPVDGSWGHSEQPEAEWDNEDLASKKSDLLTSGIKDRLPTDHGFAPLVAEINVSSKKVHKKENKAPAKATFEEDDLMGKYDPVDAVLNQPWGGQTMKAPLDAKEFPALGSKVKSEARKDESWGDSVNFMDKPVQEPPAIKLASSARKDPWADAPDPLDSSLIDKLASVKIAPAEPSEAELYNPDNKYFNVEKYYNIFTLQYKCPYKACKSVFLISPFDQSIYLTLTLFTSGRAKRPHSPSWPTYAPLPTATTSSAAAAVFVTSLLLQLLPNTPSHKAPAARSVRLINTARPLTFSQLDMSVSTASFRTIPSSTRLWIR